MVYGVWCMVYVCVRVRVYAYHIHCTCMHVHINVWGGGESLEDIGIGTRKRELLVQV